MRTPAKINLILRVSEGTRSDGYHEIDTVFFPLAAPSDTAELSLSSGCGPGIRILCGNPDVPSDPEKNLCGKAVRAYCAAASIPVPDCVIRLHKEIPCAAGMGGGSSDAAAVLLQMERHFRMLSPDRLADAAFRVGADVAFFLDPVPSRATGAGERIQPLPRLPHVLPLVIAAPCFPVSAKWAYDHWKPEDSLPEASVPALIRALEQGNLPEAAGYMKNSLAPALYRKFPLLSLLRSALLDQGALCAEITGSGPSLFGLFPSFEEAASASVRLAEMFPPVRFFTETPE